MERFKCFQSLRLPLARLTLVTGFNAAGKSTALQALLLMAQAFRADPNGLLLPLSGPILRLGSPGEVLSEHGSRTDLVIELTGDRARARWTFEPRGASHGTLTLAGAEYEEETSPARTWSDALWPGDHLTSALALLLKGVVFVGGVRLGAEEAFPIPDESGRVHGDVGADGRFAPWWYTQAADEEVPAERRHPHEPATSFRRQVDAYMSDLFPGGEANAEQILRTSLVRLQLRQGITDDWRRPINIGYGFTYAFPVLVALLLANLDQVVVLDSPEAHLHPRAQSTMGRILARFAAAGVQVIAETHSDHVMNGVRLAVRDGLIAHEDVALHFFAGPTAENHGVVSPNLDRSGRLDSWPTGFFDQAEQDLAELAGWSAG